MSNVIAQRNSHYPALDGLRGVAVIMVLLHHFVRGYSSTSPVHLFLDRFTIFMWSGVDLFFVLSGFLITGILIDAKGKRRYFRTFYARRVLRIFPLYYGALFILLIALPHFGIETVTTGQSYYWGYLTNLSMNGWPNVMVSHLWTLAIEEQFYFVWPLVIFFQPVKVLRWTLPFLIPLPMVLRLIESLSGFDIISLHVGTLTHCDGLVIGSVIAVYIRTSRAPFRVSNTWAIGTALFIAAVFVRASFGYFPITFTMTNWNVLQRTILFSVFAAGYAWLLYLCIDSANSVQQFFQSKGLRWMGRYSYGIYVLHKPLIALLIMIPLPASVVRIGSHYPALLDIGYILVFFVASLTIAYVSYHLFEKHFLKLKRYFEYSGGVPRSSAEQALEPTAITA